MRIGTIAEIQSMLTAGRYQEALAGATEAQVVAPPGQTNDLRFLMARSLCKLDRSDEAIPVLEAALSDQPDHLECRLQMGNILYQRRQPLAAIAHFEQALAVAPDDFRVHSWLAFTAFEIGDYERTRRHAGSADLQAPDRDFRFARMRLFAEILDPFSDGEAILRAAAGIARHAGTYAPRTLPRRGAVQPLRVGVYCSFFHIMSGQRFILPQLAAIPADRVEIVLLNDSRTPLPETRGLVAHDVNHLTDDQLLELFDRLGVHVMLDLDGSVQRYGAWARRAAPVQLAAYNYPFPSGMPTFDGFISDGHILPPGFDHHFSETVFRLQAPAYAFEIPSSWPAPGPLPALQNGYVTFGFFGNPIKLNTHLLRSWAPILLALPGARLRLAHPVYHNGSYRDAWLGRMEEAGLPAGRVDFLPPTNPDEIWRHYAAIDIALDPFPYHGGHTMMEALCLGTPSVSLLGNRMISRHGASFLTHAGLPTLLARTEAEYVQQVIELARDLPRLATLRRDLRDRVARSALCDLPAAGVAWADTLNTAWRKFNPALD